jgi:integrase
MAKRGQNEGSIFEERPGRWIALLTTGYDIVDGRRRRRRKKFVAATRGAVQRKLTEALREQQTGGIVPMQRDSLGAFLKRFPAQLRAAGRSAKTISSYEWIIRTYIDPVLGRIPLTQLRQTHINDFMERKLEAGLSARTVAYCHAIIRSALSRAVKDGLVSRNAAKSATPPAQRRGSSIEPLSVEDARRFLDAVKDSRWEALYSAAIALGLREGEALGLEWTGINMDAGTLTVTQTVKRIPGAAKRTPGAGLLLEKVAKTPKSLRTLELPSFAVRSLIAHKATQAMDRALAGERWQEHGLVFPSTIGKPMEPRNLLRHFHKTLEKLAIERRRFHDLRHTAASLMLAQGATLHEVAKILGHTTTRLTEDLYGHIYKAAKREIAMRMDQALAPALKPVAPSVAPLGLPERIM